MRDVQPLPNVQDEPRPWLARAVLLGARVVTAMVVGSGALLAVSLLWVELVQGGAGLVPGGGLLSPPVSSCRRRRRHSFISGVSPPKLASRNRAVGSMPTTLTREPAVSVAGVKLTVI